MPAAPRNWDVRWVDETGSTNADALALARSGAPEGVVLVADHQTAGRGRLGRTWQAPARSSLLATVLLRPTPSDAALVMPAVATAMAAAVETCTGVQPGLKWPNDLTVDDRKLAGVLAETDWSDAGVAVCVGVGVNCNWPADLPDELASTLVALNHLTGADVDRATLLSTFLSELDGRYAALDRRSLRDEWRARSATIGRRVRVELGSESVNGLAVDISAEGHLEVACDDGSRRGFAVGDVTHLRHASPPPPGDARSTRPEAR